MKVALVLKGLIKPFIPGGILDKCHKLGTNSQKKLYQSCLFGSDQHFSFKHFPKTATVTKMSLKPKVFRLYTGMNGLIASMPQDCPQIKSP